MQTLFENIIENIVGSLIAGIMATGSAALVFLLWWQIWQYTLVS